MSCEDLGAQVSELAGKVTRKCNNQGLEVYIRKFDKYCDRQSSRAMEAFFLLLQLKEVSLSPDLNLSTANSSPFRFMVRVNVRGRSMFNFFDPAYSPLVYSSFSSCRFSR